MRVLGIDCGTEYTGYGVVDLLSDDRLVCIVCGAIKVSPRDPMPSACRAFPSACKNSSPNIAPTESRSKTFSTPPT